MIKRVRTIAIVLLLSAILAFSLSQSSFFTKDSQLLIPEVGEFYHGVYPGGQTGEEDDITLNDLLAYERAAGKEVAWVYFSNNWYKTRDFPLETAIWIRDAGAIPYIRLMLRSSIETNRNEPLFTLDAIVKGDFDNHLSAWGREAALFKTPLIVEYGTEVNGEWFPWNASWNGKVTGTEKFQRAYRHIIDTMRKAGASNISWVFHVNAYDWPERNWNRFEAYYPGDNYIDWFGISVYGVQSPTETTWGDFSEALDDAVPRLKTLSNDKPIFVVEFGSSIHPRLRASDWADEALTALLSGRWPEVRGFSWWNETFQNDSIAANDSDFRVQSVPGLSEVFRKQLASAKVLSEPLLK